MYTALTGTAYSNVDKTAKPQSCKDPEKKVAKSAREKEIERKRERQREKKREKNSSQQDPRPVGATNKPLLMKVGNGGKSGRSIADNSL